MAPSRAELWNCVEAKNRRADAQVAREFLVALPNELNPEQRRRLAVDFSQELADRYGIAADVAIHAPGLYGDQRNHHAHILTTTNRVDGDGLGNKARELDLVAHTMGGGVHKSNEIDRIRARWAELANQRLRAHGHEARIDHRTLEAQGIKRAPTKHLGPTASAIERRNGALSMKRINLEREALEGLTAAKLTGELEREESELATSIFDLSCDLRAAKEARIRELVESGKRNAWEAFNKLKQDRKKETSKGFELDEGSGDAEHRLNGMLSDFVGRRMIRQLISLDIDNQEQGEHERGRPSTPR